MLAEIVIGCLVSIPAALPVVPTLPLEPPLFGFDRQDPTIANSLFCADGAPTAFETGGERSDDPPVLPALARPVPKSAAPPATTTVQPAKPSGVNWLKLARDSTLFLGIMQGFRWGTEAGTRSGGVGLDRSYLNAVGNLHGWADGDPFYVNYVGHPMQGGVSGRLFQLNDSRYYRTSFGKDPDYWKGKLRATAFAWAFSEQFEIGAISEASIGHIQAYFPQQGFVDHVITPTMGLAWMVGEDAIDRYIIQRIEDHTTNRWWRMAARTGLNPARSFANVLDWRAPWDRGSREGVLAYRAAPKDSYAARVMQADATPNLDLRPAPFEFSIASGYRVFSGTPCLGAGGEGAYRVADQLQLILSVNGCKLLGVPTNDSGDGLVFQVGPRWTPLPMGKWSPYAHILVGGLKITQEQFYPAKKVAVEAANPNIDPSLAYTLHDQYTTHEEGTGFAITAGAGINYKLSAAFAIRAIGIDYLHSNVDSVNGMRFSSGFQISSGMILRLGTW